MPDYHRIDLSLKETAVHAFYHCLPVNPFWDHVSELTARIDPEHIVPICLKYACENVSPPYSGVRQMVFLALLAEARMMMWTTRMERILRYERYSHQDLIGFGISSKGRSELIEKVCYREFSTKDGYKQQA